MNARELGMLMGCKETGLDYEKIYSFDGANDAYEKSASYVKSSVEVLNAVQKIMEYGNVPDDSDVYRLVKSAAYKGRNGLWDDACDRVVRGIYRFTGKVERVKQANASALVPWLGAGMKGIAALSAMTGIGIGTLYWALKRSSSQEALPNEKLKSRIDQYHTMARDLESTIGAEQSGE
jgi:hypothetical protein